MTRSRQLAAIMFTDDGKILQYYGDGTLSIFNSAIDEVQCGTEMQLDFLKQPSIPVRIGIQIGDIIFSEDEISEAFRYYKDDLAPG